MGRRVPWMLVALAIAGCPGGGGPSTQAVDDWLSRNGADPSSVVEGEGPPRGPVAGRLAVTVEAGRELPDTDDGPGVTDPYVIVEYEGYRWETSVAEGSQEPVWGDSFVFDVRPGGVLTVTLMDEDALGSDEKLGVMSLPLDELRVGETRKLELAFRNGEMGFVTLALTGLARP